MARMCFAATLEPVHFANSFLLHIIGMSLTGYYFKFVLWCIVFTRRANQTSISALMGRSALTILIFFHLASQIFSLNHYMK